MAVEEMLASYTISSDELAEWLEAQDQAKLWMVTGDPYLMGMLSLPANGAALAKAVRRLRGRLELFVEPGTDTLRLRGVEPAVLYEPDSDIPMFMARWQSRRHAYMPKWVLREVRDWLVDGDEDEYE